MTHEDRIVRANEELITKGDLSVIPSFFSPNYVVHAGGKDYHGHAFIGQFLGVLRTAVPDVRVVDVAIRGAAGDTISWERTLRGTHTADMLGIPPSGKRVEWRELVVSRFGGELIAEEWSVSDLAGQLLLKLPRG